MAIAAKGSVSWTAMPARDQRVLLAAAIGTSALLLLAALAGHPDLLVYSAPLFLVAAPLLAGHYVGAEQLERLATRRSATLPRRPPVAARPSMRRPAALLPRGGRLIGEALAVRPPPLLATS
jgi:hypothetical protein